VCETAEKLLQKKAENGEYAQEIEYLGSKINTCIAEKQKTIAAYNRVKEILIKEFDTINSEYNTVVVEVDNASQIEAANKEKIAQLQIQIQLERKKTTMGSQKSSKQQLEDAIAKLEADLTATITQRASLENQLVQLQAV